MVSRQFCVMADVFCDDYIKGFARLFFVQSLPKKNKQAV